MTLLYADDAAYLVQDEPQRYALGDPAAPLLVLNAADEFGVMWVCEEPDGWDSPSIDLPLDRRQGGHGAIPGEPTYEERTLSFTGSAEAPTPAAARAARTRLLRAFLDAVRSGEELLYTHLDEQPARSLYVLPSGQPRVAVDGRWIDYAFVLVAGDPIKRGADATYGPVRLLSTAAEPGRSYTAGNRTYMAGLRSYPGGGSLAATVAFVPNVGDESAPALFRIAGPVPSPIVQLGTGEYVELNLDLGALDTAEVDTDAGTVYVNGVNRFDALVGRSTFPQIPPGGTEVRLRSRIGGSDPTAALTITTTPRWT